MSLPFIKFPTTPHIITPPGGDLRGDKLVSPEIFPRLMSEEVTVEEKVDGANVGIWFDDSGVVKIQNRGGFVETKTHPQFHPLKAWVAERERILEQILGQEYVLFGEWCYARHTFKYDHLPDYFLGFDIFERGTASYLAVTRRNALLNKIKISQVPILYQGVLKSTDRLLELLSNSCFGPGMMEGLYIRLDEGEYLTLRAKYVRSQFIQPGEPHWSARELEKNLVYKQSDLTL